MPSVDPEPNLRWSTDLARGWCAQDRCCTTALVIDCCSRELLGWRLSKTGKAKTVESALEEALINRFGCLGSLTAPLVLAKPTYGRFGQSRCSSSFNSD